ncbi:MAG: respiratory nitrate reductase subunit gamma [Deltaproteobacteria bacterium]|nr:respiratory nitrate reductase subunit gamma [Deltaproteobacteria bacterium]
MDWNSVLYGQLPYVIITIAVVGTIARYVTNAYSWSSQSSQFLENKVLFFGSFPWHFGIVLVLLAHIFAIFFPSAILSWNAVPFRLYALEVTGLILGLLALFGLIMFVYRRLTDSRVRAVTSTADVLVIIILLVQVISGVATAIYFNWGSNWFAASAVPWIWSIITFSPDVAFIAGLPLLAKIHIFNAMLFILLIPFSRFVHFLAIVGPIQYVFGRPYQLVRWYGPRGARTEPIRQYK